MSKLTDIFDKYPERTFLIADGFDDAVIGVNKSGTRLIYSADKCVKILMKDMDYEEAWEFFEFNVAGAYMGEQTPIWRYKR